MLFKIDMEKAYDYLQMQGGIQRKNGGNRVTMDIVIFMSRSLGRIGLVVI